MNLAITARTAAFLALGGLPALGATPLSRSERHELVNGRSDAPLLAPDRLASELSAYAQELGYDSVRVDGGDVFLVPKAGAPVPFSIGESLTSSERMRLAGRAINRLRFNTETVVAFAPIDARATTFSASNAHAASHLARLAYLDRVTVKAQLGEWGFETETFHWLEDATTDTQGFVVADKNGLIVTVFRGTSSMTDVKTDTDAVRVTPSWAATAGRNEAIRPIHVHRGFNRSLESVWPAWSAALAKAKKTVSAKKQTPDYFFAGHSLGAALTNITAFRALRGRHIDASRTQVYTNGSPRAGDEAFRDAFSPLAARSFRMVNSSSLLTDMITRVPLKSMGYSHAGNLVLLSDREPEIISWAAGSSRGAVESATEDEARRRTLDPDDEELAGMTPEQMEREFARAAGLAPEEEIPATRGVSVPGVWLHFMGTYLDRCGRDVIGTP